MVVYVVIQQINGRSNYFLTFIFWNFLQLISNKDRKLAPFLIKLRHSSSAQYASSPVEQSIILCSNCNIPILVLAYASYFILQSVLNMPSK
jgi:hypothetical protein